MTTSAGPGPSQLAKAPEPEEIDRRRSWTCEHCVLFREAGPHRNRAAAHSFHARPGAGSADGAPRPALP